MSLDKALIIHDCTSLNMGKLTDKFSIQRETLGLVHVNRQTEVEIHLNENNLSV